MLAFFFLSFLTKKGLVVSLTLMAPEGKMWKKVKEGGGGNGSCTTWWYLELL